jgi:hypothetical protein
MMSIQFLCEANRKKASPRNIEQQILLLVLRPSGGLGFRLQRWKVVCLPRSRYEGDWEEPSGSENYSVP